MYIGCDFFLQTDVFFRKLALDFLYRYSFFTRTGSEYPPKTSWKSNTVASI